jgi:hypothetical protein
MRFVIAFVLVLFAAPLAAETEKDDRKPEDREQVEPTIVTHAAETPELVLTPVVVEERAATDDGVAQDMPQRGSFWWIVGAIVVAGVILAVLL